MKSNTQAYSEWLDGKTSQRSRLLEFIQALFSTPLLYAKRCARLLWKVVTL